MVTKQDTFEWEQEVIINFEPNSKKQVFKQPFQTNTNKSLITEIVNTISDLFFPQKREISREGTVQIGEDKFSTLFIFTTQRNWLGYYSMQAVCIVNQHQTIMTAFVKDEKFNSNDLDKLIEAVSYIQNVNIELFEPGMNKPERLDIREYPIPEIVLAPSAALYAGMLFISQLQKGKSNLDSSQEQLFKFRITKAGKWLKA